MFLILYRLINNYFILKLLLFILYIIKIIKLLLIIKDSCLMDF